MKTEAATGSSTDSTNQVVRRQSHAASFAKVVDGRKQPIRGLWVRNDRYYAQIAVEDSNTGIKAVRRVPLMDKDDEPVQTVAQAVAALERLRTQRADDDLPQLGQTPQFSAYADQYLEYIKSGTGEKNAGLVANESSSPDKSGTMMKKAGTIAKETSTLVLWKAHLGTLRLDKIKPVHVSAFVQKRLKNGMTKRTAKLDVITLRNVLKRARDIDQHIKTLPIPPGLNRELRSTPPKRSLFEMPDFEKLCAAALDKKEDGKPVTKNGQQFCGYLRLMAYSGARRNETLRLQWKDVDFEREQLTVGSDGDTKNSNYRVVDFNPKLKRLLLDLKKRIHPVSQWLFPSPQRGAKDKHTKTFKESLNRARTHAKLPGIAFHDLRHHFISYAVMSGIDYMTIAKWVGHRDGGVLIGKVYGHLADNHAKAQVQRMSFGE
jgi:integrase